MLLSSFLITTLYNMPWPPYLINILLVVTYRKSRMKNRYIEGCISWTLSLLNLTIFYL